MSLQKNIVIALAAFGLGFYASEYRHAQQPQPVVNAFEPAPATPLPVVEEPAMATIPTDIASSIPSATPLPQELSLLERAQQHIANNAFPAAVQVLNDILQKNPSDTEALLLLARVLEKQGKHEEAVATWFRYLNSELDVKKFQEATAYLSRYLTRLVNSPGIFGSSREWLMAQLNDLIKLTPDNGELHLQLADMHVKSGDQEQAQYHALMAANQDNTRIRAEEFLARLTDDAIAAQADDQESTIQLTRFGKQFLVPISVDGRNVKLLLDTGASISGLTSNFLNRNYGIVKSPKPIQLNTASGTVDSILFVVDSLQFAEVTFNKHMLARLPMDDLDSFDGLLGVDILGRFDFVIDQEKAILRLRKRQ